MISAFVVAVLIPAFLMHWAAIAYGETCTKAGNNGKFVTDISYGICRKKNPVPRFGSEYNREYKGCILGLDHGYTTDQELATDAKTPVTNGIYYECKKQPWYKGMGDEPLIETKGTLESDQCHVWNAQEKMNEKCDDGNLLEVGRRVFRCDVDQPGRSFHLKPYGCAKGTDAIAEWVPFGTSWTEKAASNDKGVLSIEYTCAKHRKGPQKIKSWQNKNACEISDGDDAADKKRVIDMGKDFSTDEFVYKCKLAPGGLTARLEAWGCVKQEGFEGDDTLEVGKGIWRLKGQTFGPATAAKTAFITFTCEQYDETHVAILAKQCEVDGKPFGLNCAKVFGDTAVICRGKQDKLGKIRSIEVLVISTAERTAKSKKYPEPDCK